MNPFVAWLICVSYPLIRPLLFRLDPERAHRLTIWLLLQLSARRNG